MNKIYQESIDMLQGLDRDQLLQVAIRTIKMLASLSHSIGEGASQKVQKEILDIFQSLLGKDEYL